MVKNAVAKKNIEGAGLQGRIQKVATDYRYSIPISRQIFSRSVHCVAGVEQNHVAGSVIEH